MELELKKERFACYRALPQLFDTHEETAETIIPDYLPDIARIVDAYGCLLLRSREITDGKASAAGQIRMTLLYIAEGTKELRSFEYSLPLSCTFDGRTGEDAVDSCLEGRLCAPEIRMLNPRKILTRASVELTLSPYAPCALTMCSGVEDQAAYQIETLCEKREIPMIRGIREKEFTFADEVLLSSTKEPIRELLRTRCALRVTDCKEIGNKLALKGLALFEALYLDAGGNIAQASSELPFSQILDGLAEEDANASVRSSLRLTGAEIRIGSESEPDNDRLISLKLSISAFAVLSERRSVCCIADLYSTSYELSAKTENVEFSGEPASFMCEQIVREKIETGAEVQSVLSTDISFCNAGVSLNGTAAELRAAATLRVLYLDENNAPLLSERRAEVSLRTDLPDAPLGRVGVRDVCAGDISVSIGADGVELRFPVQFTLSVAETPCYPCLTSLQAEKRVEESAELPSIILRAVKQGERLWDIAKQYRTTVDTILAANELAEESAALAGKLLLIPRRR